MTHIPATLSSNKRHAETLCKFNFNVHSADEENGVLIFLHPLTLINWLLFALKVNLALRIYDDENLFEHDFYIWAGWAMHTKAR